MNEDYRPAIHECGHSLMSALWLGCFGSVTLDGKGNGQCSAKDWRDDLGIVGPQGAPYALHLAHYALAGELAERMIFGDADGVSRDQAAVQACTEFLQEKDIHLSRDTLVATSSYLLAPHRRALLAMAHECYSKWVGTTSGKVLRDIALARDPTLICVVDEQPLLHSKGLATWRTRWQALCDNAGIPSYARGRSESW